MKPTRKQISTASNALGYKVDAERITEALNSVEKGITLREAKKMLNTAERIFAQRGGRGVEIADYIDNLRIFIACVESGKVAQKAEHIITMKVQAPPHLSVAEVKALVKRLMDCGKEDAENAPGDWDDPQTEDAILLDYTVE